MEIIRYVSEIDINHFISRIIGAEELFRCGSEKPMDEYGEIEFAKYIPISISIPDKNIAEKMDIDTRWIDKQIESKSK